MRHLGLLSLGFALALVACSPSGPEVTMSDELIYRPATLIVATGTMVTWTNEGKIAHSVTADQSELPSDAPYFSSGDYSSEQEARDHLAGTFLTEGETFSVKFDEPGTYKYFCLPHEEQAMRGTIVVED